jgi:hypothetical protein
VQLHREVVSCSGDPATTMTVVSWDLGGTGAQQLQQRAVLDSLRISPQT